MTALQRVLTRNTTGRGEIEYVPVLTATPGGIPGLDPTTGLLAQAQMPSGVGPDTDSSGVCSATALTAGMYVNIYNATGTKTIRPADNTDNTKPAHGFVLAGYTVGQSVIVYLPGSRNTLIPVGSFAAADVGKALYLSTSGGVTTTRPSGAAGALEQYLGDIVDVGTTVTSDFTPGREITVA
jgi:hypothetical protein